MLTLRSNNSQKISKNWYQAKVHKFDFLRGSAPDLQKILWCSPDDLVVSKGAYFWGEIREKMHGKKKEKRKSKESGREKN